MHENVISRRIIGCAIEVHRQLGPGLLESVYEEALCYELRRDCLHVQRQQAVPIRYKDVLLATPLRLDLLVEQLVIVDTKSKVSLTPIDKQQLLTYLRLKDVRLGLLINFHVTRLVDGVVRVVNRLNEEDGYGAEFAETQRAAEAASKPRSALVPTSSRLCGPLRLRELCA